VVAEIRVHEDDVVARAELEAVDLGGAEAELAGALEDADLVRALRDLELLRDLLRPIGTAVLDDDDLLREAAAEGREGKKKGTYGIRKPSERHGLKQTHFKMTSTGRTAQPSLQSSISANRATNPSKGFFGTAIGDRNTLSGRIRRTAAIEAAGEARVRTRCASMARGVDGCNRQQARKESHMLLGPNDASRPRRVGRPRETQKNIAGVAAAPRDPFLQLGTRLVPEARRAGALLREDFIEESDHKREVVALVVRREEDGVLVDGGRPARRGRRRRGGRGAAARGGTRARFRRGRRRLGRGARHLSGCERARGEEEIAEEPIFQNSARQPLEAARARAPDFQTPASLAPRMLARVAVLAQRPVAFGQAQLLVRRAASTVRFTKDHEYVRVEGGVATCGITDFAQKALGDVVFVALPNVGDKFKQGCAARRERRTAVCGGGGEMPAGSEVILTALTTTALRAMSDVTDKGVLLLLFLTIEGVGSGGGRRLTRHRARCVEAAPRATAGRPSHLSSWRQLLPRRGRAHCAGRIIHAPCACCAEGLCGGERDHAVWRRAETYRVGRSARPTR
jgi:hypothetical protein